MSDYLVGVDLEDGHWPSAAISVPQSGHAAFTGDETCSESLGCPFARCRRSRGGSGGRRGLGDGGEGPCKGLLEGTEKGAHGGKGVCCGRGALSREGQGKRCKGFETGGNLDEKATRAIGSVRFGLGCFRPKIAGRKAWGAGAYFGRQINFHVLGFTILMGFGYFMEGVLVSRHLTSTAIHITPGTFLCLLIPRHPLYYYTPRGHYFHRSPHPRKHPVTSRGRT